METFRIIHFKGNKYITYVFIDSDGEEFAAMQKSLRKCRTLKNQFINQKRKKSKWQNLKCS